jgi:hypothetical protein
MILILLIFSFFLRLLIGSLDIHGHTVVATGIGKGIKTETRTFGTKTSSLIELGAWLESLGLTDGAKENTGI